MKETYSRKEQLLDLAKGFNKSINSGWGTGARLGMGWEEMQGKAQRAYSSTLPEIRKKAETLGEAILIDEDDIGMLMQLFMSAGNYDRVLEVVLNWLSGTA